MRKWLMACGTVAALLLAGSIGNAQTLLLRCVVYMNWEVPCCPLNAICPESDPPLPACPWPYPLASDPSEPDGSFCNYFPDACESDIRDLPDWYFTERMTEYVDGTEETILVPLQELVLPSANAFQCRFVRS